MNNVDVYRLFQALEARHREDKVQLEKTYNTIGEDTLQLVIDLIRQGSLLNGDAYLEKVEDFRDMIHSLNAYSDMTDQQRDNLFWKESYKYPFARFRTELIGTLCTELAEGKELAKACTDWNKRVDPANYMKAKAPITQQMIDSAKARENNRRILEHIARKQDEELAGKSIDELQAMLEAED